ncbi:MAG: hypothetical protein AB7D05_09680, partial [Mangrovibacterium sp.]
MVVLAEEAASAALAVVASVVAVPAEAGSTVLFLSHYVRFLLSPRGEEAVTLSEETSFFGVNYTLPFAHAFRAAGYLGADRKAAIDRDVYHFARLGLNAYRIHVWDVEITDSLGNLIENEHLDLLDYLIARLAERNIRSLITAQTNFGNGYPERNRQTGGFSCQYDRCSVHADPAALAAQERYLGALVRHVNPYTGKTYLDDPCIVGFELNNEPCHAGTREQTRAYINRMLLALKLAGNCKPVFYNVSHNLQQAGAYFSTDIQGTTYQWYPSGLVAGHTRKGNFLPHVDAYPIPFDSIPACQQKARLVYEFDAADLTGTYIYPAMARSFRTAGFQWITQFAYDPLELAAYNTEYQTHYLNLVYTPRKALSLMIAAQAAYRLPRGADFGSYPQDTLFGDFRVSYKEDLSVLNSGDRYYYSNHTNTVPVNPAGLESVAGWGCSPLVQYEGTGAYLLDRLEEGVWRLELMPDAVQLTDPFAKTSFSREVVRIIHGEWDMTLCLPDLGGVFTVKGLNECNPVRQKCSGGLIRLLKPGVYLLQREGLKPRGNWNSDSFWKQIRLGEYVVPEKPACLRRDVLVHQARETAEAGTP